MSRRRDDELHRRLATAPLPGATDAERRAWELALSAAPPLRARSRRPRLRATLALALAGAAGVLAATPPGEAIGDWFTRAVDPAPTRTVEVEGLPAPGRVLARGANGIAIVGRNGERTRLGNFAGAAWSPRGLFVVAWRGASLYALERDGDVRWRIETPRAVHGGARWSPDGYRIAYLAGGLRVVAGDGSGDRPLAAARPVAPEWRPGQPHTVAYVTLGRRIEVRDVDTWRPVYRSPQAVARTTTALAWSPDGRRIAAIAPGGVRSFDLHGGGRVAHAGAPGSITAAAFSPDGNRLALVTYLRGRSRLSLGDRTLFTAAGRFRGLAWSPDGRWLLVGWRSTDQWVAVRTHGAPRLKTLAGRGGTPAGWCCARSAVYGPAAPTR